MYQSSPFFLTRVPLNHFKSRVSFFLSHFALSPFVLDFSLCSIASWLAFKFNENLIVQRHMEHHLKPYNCKWVFIWLFCLCGSCFECLLWQRDHFNTKSPGTLTSTAGNHHSLKMLFFCSFSFSLSFSCIELFQKAFNSFDSEGSFFHTRSTLRNGFEWRVARNFRVVLSIAPNWMMTDY